MIEQLYIPKNIKVGFNTRDDTYSKKLAYIIYYDDKGKLRKENSWMGWIEKEKGYNPHEDNELSETVENIFPVNLLNEPMEGFVINKGVGGQRESYGWNARNEYIRVFDPRGFEFEISVANLLYVLQECTSTKGKGLEGEFVYSWAGKELILLPVNTIEYRNSKEFSNLQKTKVTKKDMVVGHTYMSKKQEELIYLGRFDFHDINGYSDYTFTIIKKHIFYDIKNERFVQEAGFTKLSIKISDECVENYASLVEKYQNSRYGSKPVDVILKPTKINIEKIKIDDYRDRYSYYIKHNNRIYNIVIYDNENSTYNKTTTKEIKLYYECEFKNNTFKYDYFYGRHDYDNNITVNTYEELLDIEVYEYNVILESGTEIDFKKYIKN